jgi:uncharacterized RDD family membrane protein YckC
MTDTTVTVIPPAPEWADPWRHPFYYRGITIRRIFAYLLDVAIVTITAGLVWIATGIFSLLTLGLLWPLQALFVALVPLLYHSLLIAGPDSATLGMRAAGIRVMSIAPGAEADGGRPTLFQAMIQTVAFYGSMAVTGSLILLLALFNPRRRALHDFLAGTVVVNDRRLWQGDPV